MRRLILLLMVILPAAGLSAAEPVGTTCDLDALVDRDDAGVLATYDGLRKGLEIARLPRVCQVETEDGQAGVEQVLERLARVAAPRREGGLAVDPFFAVGERSSRAVAEAGTHLPCVLGLTRYTVQREPLVPLPRVPAGVVAYADIPVEQVATLVRDMLARPDMSAAERARQPAAGLLPVAGADDGLRVRFQGAFGGRLTTLLFPPSPTGVEFGTPVEDDEPWAVLCLHLDPRGPAPDFEQALRTARERGVPLVSDNRAHFGMGAVVVLVPRHDILGRVMAEEGRKLRAGEPARESPRIVPGFEVWVDLAAADAIPFELPLAFLARADRIKRGRPGAPGSAAR